MQNNNFLKNILVHIKYPYTALIIAVMWISIAIIIIEQNVNIDLLLICTTICTVIISFFGFRSSK